MEAVTRADLVEALREALAGDKGPDDALTTKEIVDQLLAAGQGKSRAVLERKVRAAIASGSFERVKVQRISPVDFRNSTVTAYRLKESR